MSKPGNFELDQSLVQGCLRGNEGDWAKLVDHYKNLIYSIPVKLGFSQEDAAEIFQSVCVSLFEELPRLREPRALPAWLIQTTSRRCFRFQYERRRYSESENLVNELADVSTALPEKLLEDLNREQIVRDAVAELIGDCRRLVELLFYEMPPLNYDELAKILDMPKGSIGPTRMRCLERVRQILLRKGF